MLSIAASGCVPIGDCWPDVAVTVGLGGDAINSMADPVVVAAAVEIAAGDVAGTDSQAVPSGRAQLVPLGGGPITTSRTFTVRGYPYPAWYIAFFDTNRNQQLDVGEAFGVDAENPRPGTCEAYASTILIDRVRR